MSDYYYNKEPSGIVWSVSRQAGTVAGTSVVISKKIAGCGVKTITAAKDWITWPLKVLVPARDEKSTITSQAYAFESMDELESERLKKARKKGPDRKSHPLSDYSHAPPKKGTALFDRAPKKVEVLSTGEKKESAMEQTVAQPVKQLNAKIREQLSRRAPKTQMPTVAAAMNKQVEAAVFSNKTDKIIFMRALSDLASQDATIRVDAAKTIARIHHELSVKALVGQMAAEPSAQVRRECIKALATLQLKGAVSAVKPALKDEAASVRLAAVWGLYHLAGAQSAPELIRMFADKNEEVRRRAATCIGWLGQKESAVKLLILLDDDTISVRRAAIEAMGNLRNRQAVSSLIQRLNDPVKLIRKAVLSAIETITGKKMSNSFPKDEKEFERLAARWRQWWKEEFSG